ncbi:MAG TPA: hypothetical protein VMR98_02615, partial [Candidatus Polarisedimenticolaceae bacterium]|nr:hypothetical protein [Candidatus Polarisedimenticolaceae bacterium]
AFPGRQAARKWTYWATAAAAAVLLAVIGIAAMSMRSNPTPTQTAAEGTYIPPFRPGVAAVSPTLEPPVSPGDQPPAVETREPVVASHKRRASWRGARPNSRDSQTGGNALEVNSDSTVAANYGNEIATDFMPVGYASPLSLQDGGQVMRVELPRSALAGFGLPVNMDRVNERVKADVLVGTDGQARAIRFVQ